MASLMFNGTSLGEEGMKRWDHYGCVDGSNRSHHHFSFLFSLLQVSSSIPRRKRMNSLPWNDVVSSAEMGIFILLYEVLTFSNWALIHENLLLFLMSPLDQLQLDP